MAVDGTYNVTVEGLGKRASGRLTLKESGACLTGSVEIAGQTVAIQNGKVKGNQVTGTVAASTPIGKLKGNVTATVNGNTIEGKIKALMASATFHGTKA